MRVCNSSVILPMPRVEAARDSGYNSRAVENVDNPPALICGRCTTVCDLDDNFCKRCGMPLSDGQLPLKREQRLPDVWRPRVPAVVVRAATVVAVGTLTEIIARRLAREAGQRVANVVRLPIGRGKPKVVSQRIDEDAGAQFVSDTVFIRRIRAVGRRAR